MKEIPPYQNRRLDRRLPLDCAAYIALPGGERIEARCIEIGVGGMTLRAAYVPGESEVINVAVLSPENSRLASRPPLISKLEVTRCNAVGEGVYEIGGRIVRVLD
ncbi:MAG: PilZ domain-containing protein [Thauera sp.]|nr:PilZ domain-containing protein [Thauera sp.]